MKSASKKKIIGTTVIAVMAMAVGCSSAAKIETQTVATTETTVVTTTVSEPSAEQPKVVAVDVSEFGYRGEITIYNGEFRHERHVVDYVEGDPAGITGRDDVLGIYIVRRDGESTAETRMILSDGSVEVLEGTKGTALEYLLPRASGEYGWWTSSSEGEIYISLKEDKTYAIRVNGAACGEFAVSGGILDAWIAYNTIYWMVGDVVYSLDWWTEGAKPEVYYSGAVAVSHHCDEAEGALVPLEQANAAYYSRHDIYSPCPCGELIDGMICSRWYLS